MSDIKIKKVKDYYHLIVNKVNVGGAWVGDTTIVKPKDFMGKKDKVIMAFFIKIENRKQGFGKILIQKIIESEKKSGTKTLRLGVEMNNEPAIKIYKGAGFIIDDKVGETMHYMWKTL